MFPRPVIFVSAVSQELRSARELVAQNLLGFSHLLIGSFNEDSARFRMQ